MAYHLRTFGGLDLRDAGGEPIEALLAHSKGMALLVYLAVEVPEEGLDRGRATGLLWPDREETRARNALSITLTRLRQATESPLIEGKGERILRAAQGRLEADVWAFREALERGDVDRALSLYRGHFLEGFELAEVRRFERWADDRRERFRDQAHEAALTAGRAAREAGTLEDATAAFERALELRPLRESAATELVWTLAEGGRTAEALQRYEAFRRRRDEELDLAPSEEFEALIGRIRAGEVEGPGSEATPPRGSGGGTVGEGTDGAGPGGADTGMPPWRRPTGWAIAALVLAAAALGLWQLAEPDGGATSPADDRSVAVLPFEPIGTEDPGPIAEGLHSDLLTRLSNVAGLRVISATSVERFRDTDLSLPAVADSLGVEWVVEGDVQRADETFQVNAQLVDARTDAHAWARTYRRELTAPNLFDLQGDITREIVQSLEAELTTEERERVERRPTRDLEAYRLYAQGRRLMLSRRPDPLHRAIDRFERAIERDSSYALAWAGLADARILHAHYSSLYSSSPETASDSIAAVFPEAELAARRALELNPDLAESHASRAKLYRYDQGHLDARSNGPAALRHLRRAVELRPSYAQAHHWLGNQLRELGRPDRGLEHHRLAVELSPDNRSAQITFLASLLANGRYKEALSEARRLQELYPGATSYIRTEANALLHLKRRAEARSLVREYLGDMDDSPRWTTDDPPRWTVIYSAIADAALGDTTAARARIEDLRARGEEFDAALVHAALGELDLAFQGLPEIENWRSVTLRYFYPDLLSAFRADSRYQELIRRYNEYWGLNPDGSLPEVADGSFDE